MRILRGFQRAGAAGCALTIGNFDGVHRGHQAMLALLTSEARHRGLPSCVLTFEPNPRDFFARRAGRPGPPPWWGRSGPTPRAFSPRRAGRPESAPARVATLRDKLAELERCGIDRVVVARFDARFAAQPAQAFIDDVVVAGLGARY